MYAYTIVIGMRTYTVHVELQASEKKITSQLNEYSK